eukprot:4253151-Prymnesium_polylepis.1
MGHNPLCASALQECARSAHRPLLSTRSHCCWPGTSSGAPCGATALLRSRLLGKMTLNCPARHREARGEGGGDKWAVGGCLCLWGGRALSLALRWS